MNAVSQKRLLVVWLALSAITLVSISTGLLAGRPALTPNAVVGSGAIVIALVKTRIIFREFMEVRHAPVVLGRLTDLWVVLTGALLLLGYLAGLAFPRG